MTYHRNWPGLAFLLALISSPAAAQSDAGPVFQRSRQAGRIIEHRVDLDSVHKTWAYKTFWTRAADARAHEPVMVRQSFWPRLLADPVGALTFRQVPWSRKFVIDCTGRRIGARFLQSSDPGEASAAITLKAMAWQDLKNFHALHAALCD